MARAAVKPIVSNQVIKVLEDHFSATSSLREIREFCDAAEIAIDDRYNPGPMGERRTLFRQYLTTLDLSDGGDAHKLLTVFASVLAELEESIADDRQSNYVSEQNLKAFESMKRLLKRDGHIYKDGEIISPAANLGLDTLDAAAIELDADYLRKQVSLMREQCDSNPPLAIGAAKELIETVCKTIIAERDVEIDEKADVLQLTKATCRELKLTRDDIDDAAKAADTIRRVLSNLASVAHGLAELRNPYGSGHGKHAKHKGLQPRHARLAVGSAATLATFLFETHREQEF